MIFEETKTGASGFLLRASVILRFRGHQPCSEHPFLGSLQVLVNPILKHLCFAFVSSKDSAHPFSAGGGLGEAATGSAKDRAQGWVAGKSGRGPTGGDWRLGIYEGSQLGIAVQVAVAACFRAIDGALNLRPSLVNGEEF